jgi:hypothetical protein
MVVTGEVAKGETPRPEQGFVALFGDVQYESAGFPYHLSTQMRWAGAKEEK